MWLSCQPETLAKRPFLLNPPEADKFLRLPREMRSLFLWGQAQILILKMLVEIRFRQGLRII
jgi:hypothetical protein